MRIREIEAENFKLFTTNFHEVNEIEKSDLVVFNGPNGYGKTSVFDIIEFCLTGTIKRIGKYSEELAVKKSEAFENKILISDETKEAFVKILLDNDGQCIEIKYTYFPEKSKKSGSSKENNPHNIFECFNREIICDGEKINNQEKFLSEIQFDDIKEIFDKCCFLSQDEHLQFLKAAKKSKADGLNFLLDIPTEWENELEKIKEKINELMLDAYGEKYTKTINIIERVFKNENIKIDDSSYWECYTELLKLRLGGEKFLNEENKLTYFSDGLNSLKYIKLIIELIANLSSTGWKNPLLIIDEPEIGLHSLYIDELIECVQSNINKNVNMMLTTHSPHLVSSIIKNEISISIWRIFFENNHSKFEKMQDIIEEKQKYLISDIETGCYFSNALLFVEGKSEKQLFFNKNIKKLYPDIKKINIVNYDSDNSMLDLVYPEHMKFSVPYLVLVDMDKILKYSYRSGKFKLNSDNLVNPLYSTTVKEKQKY